MDNTPANIVEVKAAVKEVEPLDYSPKQIALVKATVAKNATDDELRMFMHLAKKTNLDPFLKEIYFIKTQPKDGRDPQVINIVSRDGMKKIAKMSGVDGGVRSAAVYENDGFSMDLANGEVKHVITDINNRGKLIGAWALVYRTDRKFPFSSFIFTADYRRKGNIWADFAPAMSIKCAENIAYTTAHNVDGIYPATEKDNIVASIEGREVAPKAVAAPEKPKLVAAPNAPVTKVLSTESAPQAVEVEVKPVVVVNTAVTPDSQNTEPVSHVEMQPVQAAAVEPVVEVLAEVAGRVVAPESTPKGYVMTSPEPEPVAEPVVTPKAAAPQPVVHVEAPVTEVVVEEKGQYMKQFEATLIFLGGDETDPKKVWAKKRSMDTYPKDEEAAKLANGELLKGYDTIKNGQTTNTPVDAV